MTRRRPAESRVPARATHRYRGDRVADHRGLDRCELCGLAEDHKVHKVPAVDPDVAEVAHRIAGEREDWA